MEFTKEEISLCKQVAERHRRKIECGDWVVIDFPHLKETVTLFDTKWSDEDTLGLYNYSTDEFYEKWFPLWTIFDCLEFLGEKYGSSIDLYKNDKVLGGQWLLKIAVKVWSGKTPLEACLKAVLAVFEEG